MTFHDVLFPLDLAFGASGGPTRLVDITELANGREVRNTAQSRSRRRYNAMTGVRSVEEARRLADFFEARSGPLHGFLFRDPIDHSSGEAVPSMTDQTIGTGDGETSQFQLLKEYDEVSRLITRPREETVRVAVNGQSVSHTLLPGGQVQIPVPNIGDVVTAGFLFDVPVRFDSDRLILSLGTHGAASATDVPLIEIFDHA